MTSNRCHSQLCAREVFSPRQPLPCGLAGRCAGVIEVARALCCLWSAAVTGCLFPSVTRSPVSVVLAALSPMRRADWSRSCPCSLPTSSVRSSSRSLVSVDPCCSSRSIGTGAVAVVDRRGQVRGRCRLSWRSWFGPGTRAFRLGDGASVGEVLRPVIHEPPPTLEQVGTGIGGFNLVLDHVRQRRLDDLPRVVGLLGSPVPERGPEAVRP